MASVFSKIIAGDIPGHFVWKDDKAVAFMTIQPIREGHVLVIPREEVDQWDDLAPELVSHLFLVSQKISRALKEAYPARRVGLMVAGLEVPHTHIHLVPMDSMADLSFEHARQAEGEALAEAARRIRAVLTAQGHQEAS
ncbi:HIT family protein [Marinimicrobium sp. ABcell2]|uniref:HIT family protein n=1 Tax=Marinimicrobium sp. ABcell2 TaxID=3069751 RepID=UPI0027B66C5C|nr:HIT family protein [Marinimicrobium sp. ABcell2]MDQ2075500.1 HIT family protein [Marinimicrobium sp. ABcell2]